jgi:hypothetical protein
MIWIIVAILVVLLICGLKIEIHWGDEEKKK